MPFALRILFNFNHCMGLYPAELYACSRLYPAELYKLLVVLVLLLFIRARYPGCNACFIAAYRPLCLGGRGLWP